MTSTAHITTPPRHPLVDAWIDAGTLVDAVYAKLYGSTDYGKDYFSFADAFSTKMSGSDGIDGYNIVSETTGWTSAVEQNCRVAASKPIIADLLHAVERRAEVAAEALQAQQRNFREDAVAELYRVYLDNFIEYLTPSTLSGKVCDGVVKEVYAMRRRCGVYTDATMLRAQAAGVVDAIVAESGIPKAMSPLPRTLDGFCEHLGVVRK